MRIGICTTDFERQPLVDLFARIEAMGYDCVQLSFGEIEEADFAPTGQIEIPGRIDDALLAAIARASRESRLPIGAINGTFNMAHPDPGVRAEGVRRFQRVCEAAQALGCPIVSLCSGTRNEAHLWRPHPDNATPSAWADMIDTMRRIVPLAQRCGIVLAVETEASNVVDTPQRARAMLEEIASPALGMVMDCANLFRVGEARAENVAPRMREAFEAFGDRVVLAHAKDIRAGEGIDFCATGEGIIDYALFAECLARVRFAGDMMVHGVYDPSKMPGALSLLRQALASD